MHPIICGDSSKHSSNIESDDHDGYDDRGAATEDSDDEIGFEFSGRAVQLLAIRADFYISAINAYDWHQGRCIYRAGKGEVQEEEGMVDLIPIGPYRMLEAYGALVLEVFTVDDEGSCTSPPITEGWGVTEDDEVKEYTQIIYVGHDRKLEITYLVIPDAIATDVEVKLNLKDLGSRSRVTVYGSIKVSAIDYGDNSIHLFNYERGKSLSFPRGSTSIIPLSPHEIAMSYSTHFKFHIEVDLRVISTWDSQEEDKNLNILS